MPGLKTAGLDDPWSSTRATLEFIWAQLSKNDHRKLLIATLALSSLSVGDFIAILLLAAVTGLVVASLTPNAAYAGSWLPFGSATPQEAIGLLGIGAVVLMAAKTYLSWRLLLRVRLFIARLQPKLSGSAYQTYLRAPYPAAQMLSRAQVTGAVDTGTAGLLAALVAVVSMVADLTLIALMVALLLLASPLLFVACLTYFGLLAYLTASVMGKRMSYYGRESYQASLAAGETTQASVGFAPEIRLYGMADSFGERLMQDQLRAATLAAHQQVLFQAPRYVFEMGVLIGFVVVAGVALVLQGPADAAFTVVLFSLTSVRLVPALQRLNGSWGSLKFGRAQSSALHPVLRLPPPAVTSAIFETAGAVAQEDSESLRLRDVSYQYPSSNEPALHEICLSIRRGSMIALVGRTGSGKSTLAGVISGLIEPSSGTVHRSGGSNWRERLAFVPQDVYISPDTVRNNVALPIVGQADDDERIWTALEMAQVDDVVAALPGGLDADLGEGGARLSGGEAQRLGLARALYRRPNMLVLDEATSSLDSQTEQRVADAVRKVAQDCTIVVIAHRLATIRNADQIVFLEAGRILATGSFEELLENVPAFTEAAALQGLAGTRASARDRYETENTTPIALAES